MPDAADYLDLADARDRDTLATVIQALDALVARALNPAGEVVRGRLADVVNAEAIVSVTRKPARLQLRFHVPPMRAGALPSHFEWFLAATVPGVDENTVAAGGFPIPRTRAAADVYVDFL